jgi:hypothetical protein
MKKCLCFVVASSLNLLFASVFVMSFSSIFSPRLVSLCVSASISFSCSESDAEHWNFQFSIIGV